MFLRKWEDKIFSKGWCVFGQEERKGRMDFLLVCELGNGKVLCLQGGLWLWSGGARCLVVVWGGGKVLWVVEEERLDGEEMRAKEGNCKKAKLCKWSKVC